MCCSRRWQKRPHAAKGSKPVHGASATSDVSPLARVIQRLSWPGSMAPLAHFSTLFLKKLRPAISSAHGDRGGGGNDPRGHLKSSSLALAFSPTPHHGLISDITPHSHGGVLPTFRRRLARHCTRRSRKRVLGQVRVKKQKDYKTEETRKCTFLFLTEILTSTAVLSVTSAHVHCRCCKFTRIGVLAALAKL